MKGSKRKRRKHRKGLSNKLKELKGLGLRDKITYWMEHGHAHYEGQKLVLSKRLRRRLHWGED